MSDATTGDVRVPADASPAPGADGPQGGAGPGRPAAEPEPEADRSVPPAPDVAPPSPTEAGPPGPTGAADHPADEGRDQGGEDGAGEDPGDAAPLEGAPGARPSGADFRLALVSAVKVDLPNQYPTVVLRETESPRRQLSFSVGLQDGIVLSHAMRRIPTPRPLTHELVSGILRGFDIDVVAVRLVGRQGAVYFAELDLRGRTGRTVHSCRPSDALTIALHQAVPVPILIDPRLFEETGDVAPLGPAQAPS